MRPFRSIALVSGTLVAACGGGSSGKSTEEVLDVQETADEVSFDVDTQPEINLPPDFGELCSGNEDCVTGFCVEGVSGFVCTKTCVEECPAGWGCKGVQSGSADIVFVCVQDGTPDHDTVGGDGDTGGGGDTLPADTTIDSQGDTIPGDTGPGDTGPGDTGPGDTTPTDTTPDTDTDVGPLGNACEAAPGPGSDNL